MNTCASRPRNGEAGVTLVEVMVAAVLAAIFFASLFELNGMCLRYIDSSKESLAALQYVQDRMEALRNRSYYDLTRTDCSPCTPLPSPAPPCVTTPCVSALMATAANAAPIAQRFTEVVRISNFPPTVNGTTQYTRTSSGTVTTDSTRTAPASDNLVQVDVQVSWTTTSGSRPRTEQTSCIVANGSKK